MPETSLYDRYMAAHTANRDHRATCAPCTGSPCPTGKRLFESFARLQDAYLDQQQRQRRR